MIRLIRVLLLALGVGAGVWGAMLLGDLGSMNFFASLSWLVGGVVVHDALIGPLVIALAVASTRLLRGPLPAPVIVGLIVVGSVTLASVPMIGRFGALADNPTLLPRNYGLGWLVFVGLVSVLVAVALLVGQARRRSQDQLPDGGEHGTSTDR